MTLRRRAVDGLTAVKALSALLLRQRSEGPLAGLYEAGDLQWWWKDSGSFHAAGTWVWADDDGTDAAWFSVAGMSPAGTPDGRVDADVGWLARSDAEVRDSLLPGIMAELAALPASPDRPVVVWIDERDEDLARRLARAGFAHDAPEDHVQMWQRPSAPPTVPTLPSGFRFDDERSRSAGTAHHLARRNGADVAARLREVSLYRPDLDLCVRDADGTVAAYCVCWLDTRNRVGLFEPVRTEDAYQRRGLGRALMTEGIRRLMTEGATTLKVSRRADNDAAAALYRSVGFADAFRKQPWQRTT